MKEEGWRKKDENKEGVLHMKPMKVKRTAKEAKWSSRNGGQAGRMKKDEGGIENKCSRKA